MAEEKKTTTTLLERKYVIPLKKEWAKVPNYRRSKKAVKAVKEFLKKHMKVEEVKIGKYLNTKILEKGRKNPPRKIEVEATKIEEKDKGVYVKVELAGAPKEEVKKPKKEKKEEKKEGEKTEEEKKKEEERKILQKGLEKKPAQALKAPKTSTQKEAEKARRETIVKRTFKK